MAVPCRAVPAAYEAELSAVLFRGGWADVDLVASLDYAGWLPASDIASASDFGVRMDQWVARVFGVRGFAQ
ncbi:hypothetical protein EES41_39375 (plasmid) [Streptomyces sp. ADI95-16]|uniref:hypothetical protein n=1 Tax=Streptomyces sp. ADI95-16 TaxID=1522758 RepID=UPI000F3A9C03|nr:hypothetical protein [Streptomyces sp. ADI95-16]AYV32835.1 hypothetical protein EES41_39375 [Streptomyces sp. ADI95-16]